MREICGPQPFDDLCINGRPIAREDRRRKSTAIAFEPRSDMVANPHAQHINTQPARVVIQRQNGRPRVTDRPQLIEPC